MRLYAEPFPLWSEQDLLCLKKLIDINGTSFSDITASVFLPSKPVEEIRKILTRPDFNDFIKSKASPTPSDQVEHVPISSASPITTDIADKISTEETKNIVGGEVDSNPIVTSSSISVTQKKPEKKNKKKRTRDPDGYNSEEVPFPLRGKHSREEREEYKGTSNFRVRFALPDNVNLSTDWCGDRHDQGWMKMYAWLCKFYIMYGHCGVPCFGYDRTLGLWAKSQRRFTNKNSLPRRRLEALKILEFYDDIGRSLDRKPTGRKLAKISDEAEKARLLEVTTKQLELITFWENAILPLWRDGIMNKKKMKLIEDPIVLSSKKRNKSTDRNSVNSSDSEALASSSDGDQERSECTKENEANSEFSQAKGLSEEDNSQMPKHLKKRKSRDEAMGRIEQFMAVKNKTDPTQEEELYNSNKIAKAQRLLLKKTLWFGTSNEKIDMEQVRARKKENFESFLKQYE